MNLEIIPLARRDIGEAANYYLRQRAGLDDEFLAEEEVDAACKTIVARPRQFEQVRPGIRRFILDRFPYGIYYRIPDSRPVQIARFRSSS